MAAFTIEGTEYRSHNFSGQDQVEITKRLMPTLTAFAQALPDLVIAAKASNYAEDPLGSIADFAGVLVPVSRELAALSDADTGFIINRCLEATERKTAVGVGWSRVRQNGVIQDQSDATFVRQLGIAWQVLSENLGAIGASLGIDLKAVLGGAGA